MIYDENLIEQANTLFGEEENNEEGDYRQKIKTTLRSLKSFYAFSKFLKNELNDEAIELYYNILKHKSILEEQGRFKISSLKYIYHNFVSENGKSSVKKNYFFFFYFFIYLFFFFFFLENLFFFFTLFFF